MHNRRTIAFCGHHDAGKDEAAAFLCANYKGCKNGRSISYYLAEYVAEREGIPLDVLRGPDRHRHADAFFRLGNEARDADPGLFLRRALAAGNVVTGIRDPREILWGRERGEVDLFVWIDRPVPPDPTMCLYGAPLCDVILPNHGPLPRFHDTLARWADFSGFRRRDGRPLDRGARRE